MRTIIPATAVALFLAGVITNGANAQSPSAAESPLTRPTPHTADGKVDLNGVWGAATLPPALKPGESVRWLLPLKGVNPEGNDVFLGLDRLQVNARAASTNKPDYKPEHLEKVKYLSDRQDILDPAFYCKPQGVPRMGPPSQIIQTPGQLVFLYGASNLFRVIPTDGRPHRADADPSYMGDSIGKFEGDTLIVDVANFNDDTWLASDGYFHTENMHVVERLWRQGDVLNYTVTVEDPAVLAKPWTFTPRILRLSTSRADALLEAPPCVEHDAPHIVTLDHH
jgi:hypothetical protein